MPGTRLAWGHNLEAAVQGQGFAVLPALIALDQIAIVEIALHPEIEAEDLSYYRFPCGELTK